MKKMLVVMDPIETINPKKDTSLALMLEAQKQGFTVFYALSSDLLVISGQAKVMGKKVKVYADEQHWFAAEQEQLMPITAFDCILMRVDPPFNMEYIYATYVLDMAKDQGVKVINDPQSLRDCNEKMFIQWFPKYIAPTLVTKNKEALFAFVKEQGKTVVKPMDSMGGQGIDIVDQDKTGFETILAQATQNFSQTVMLQKYLPQIKDGDKRIFIVHGEVIPYVLGRFPKAGSFKANLAAGGKGVAMPISNENLKLCKSVAPELKKRGLLFVGMDIIGNHITEINVTSPTGSKEIEAAFSQAKIIEKFIQAI
ncbi:MAG TPA: glutathione synthase [Oligoflexia bacterium]|nr:glutathione synthase [Oligoflexia bacterium]HMR25648.1 glutathione synthase [Oligoflexia bacterium]